MNNGQWGMGGICRNDGCGSNMGGALNGCGSNMGGPGFGYAGGQPNNNCGGAQWNSMNNGQWGRADDRRSDCGGFGGCGGSMGGSMGGAPHDA